MRLLATVFVSGMTVMATEMSASRLLAPYYGTSLFVWTHLIGFVMIALALGYYVGGRVADAHPKENYFYRIIFSAGIYLFAMPFFLKPLLRFSLQQLAQNDTFLTYLLLILSIVLVVLPLFVLGMVSPYAIRLLAKNKKTVGKVSGNVYALSTVGSIIGTFLPALVTIPLIGTSYSILLFSSLLIFFSLLALGRTAWILLFALLFFVQPTGIKPVDGLIYEGESLYHYIQVVNVNGAYHLKLNEGFATHSVYHPSQLYTGGVWDYFSLLPVLRVPEQNTMLLVGLAAGTISKQYQELYPDIRITGVEIDRSIVDVGKQYFAMGDEIGKNLAVVIGDGRQYLQRSSCCYDYVLIDAYRQPYIPFHLTTQEFFEEVEDRLTSSGVLALNVGSTTADSELLRMITNTARFVFDYVYVLPIPESLNYIVLASDEPLPFHLTHSDPQLESMLRYAKHNYRIVNPSDEVLILTDEKAPVEIYTDKMIFSYLQP